MSSRNKDIAVQFLAALDRDPDRMPGFLSDNAEYRVIAQLLNVGPFIGKNTIATQFVPMLKQLFPNHLNLEIDNVIAEGNHVAVECRSNAICANGRKYANSYHFLFEFEGDQIRSVKEYTDSQYAKETLMPG
ncbi:MAG: nuclear transport factor 2 family protein [Armatimonadota bacterium]|nr:nuclear transport factor 2 family protein [Armatimonadota bacterium]